MNNYNPVPIAKGPLNTHTAVYFEDLKRWYIRCDTLRDNQSWSVTGYDSPREAQLGYDRDKITYVATPPSTEAGA